MPKDAKISIECTLHRLEDNWIAANLPPVPELAISSVFPDIYTTKVLKAMRLLHGSKVQTIFGDYTYVVLRKPIIDIEDAVRVKLQCKAVIQGLPTSYPVDMFSPEFTDAEEKALTEYFGTYLRIRKEWKLVRRLTRDLSNYVTYDQALTVFPALGKLRGTPMHHIEQMSKSRRPVTDNKELIERVNTACAYFVMQDIPLVSMPDFETVLVYAPCMS